VAQEQGPRGGWGDHRSSVILAVQRPTRRRRGGIPALLRRLAARGGGIFATSNASSTTLRNTIVDANKADIAANLAASPTSQGHNLLGENPGSGLQKTDIVNANPLLGPLQNNGGPTQTQALLSGSPAIDKGSNTNCPSTDQRGKARPKDGDGNGKAVCDIGSFEK
jgi:hypothetical protein